MKWVNGSGASPRRVARALMAVAWVTGGMSGMAIAQSPAATPVKSYSELLAASRPADWRVLDLDNTLYMDLPAGRVVIELSAAYAPQVGFSNGFPVGRDPKSGQTWLAHCYGMVGAGRDNADTSGSGAELYAVTGHAPRHLDRNITLLGRVVQGISFLSTLPRGSGPLGFYESPGQRVPIKSIRVAGAK